MSKHTKEYYISVDIEADGPCPGINSMLQFGAVFYNQDGATLGEYCVNIHPISGAVPDKKTAIWWDEQEKKNPGLWRSMTSNRVNAGVAMQGFENRVKKYSQELNASPLVVAYPAGFDFTYTYYYLCRFLGQSCVGFSCLDMKTMAMCLLQRTYHDSAKKRFPSEWFNKNLKHTHNALDDAREQGFTFFAMKNALKEIEIKL